jgi:hypothetical protein
MVLHVRRRGRRRACFAHRVAGYLLTFALFFNIRFDDRTLFWTPSDWAWGGGLLGILLPAWVFGRPVLASRALRPEQAFAMIGSGHHALVPGTHRAEDDGAGGTASTLRHEAPGDRERRRIRGG